MFTLFKTLLAGQKTTKDFSVDRAVLGAEMKLLRSQLVAHEQSNPPVDPAFRSLQKAFLHVSIASHFPSCPLFSLFFFLSPSFQRSSSTSPPLDRSAIISVNCEIAIFEWLISYIEVCNIVVCANVVPPSL